MSSSQSDFYDRVDEIVSPQKTEKGIFLKDFALFWIPHKGLVFGQVIRIVCSPPLKSSFTVFEWKQDAHKKMKTTICIKSWSYLEVGSMWKLNTMNDFQWCDPQALLEKYVIDADQTGDVLINPSKLKLLLPTKQVEEERLEKERQKKEQDRKEAKKGAPENLTKELLKEILSENGVTFRKSSSKRELIFFFFFNCQGTRTKATTTNKTNEWHVSSNERALAKCRSVCCCHRLQ